MVLLEESELEDQPDARHFINEVNFPIQEDNSVNEIVEDIVEDILSELISLAVAKDT